MIPYQCLINVDVLHSQVSLESKSTNESQETSPEISPQKVLDSHPTKSEENRTTPEEVVPDNDSGVSLSTHIVYVVFYLIKEPESSSSWSFNAARCFFSSLLSILIRQRKARLERRQKPLWMILGARHRR